ncbi:MAG: 50S ribosomal protein L32 [Patescibacteria group bacterium]|jgi:large subunit ribosomal protein L32
MAMPKKRMSHMRSGTRRSQLSATLPTVMFCPNCHAPRQSHAVCENCGQYRGKQVVAKVEATPAATETAPKTDK